MAPSLGYSYASIADELNSLPHLTSKEKASLLSILAASGVFEEEQHQEGWIDMGTTRAGLQSAKQMPVPPERVYKVRASLQMHCTSEELLEAATNPLLMVKWDMMAKEIIELQASVDPVNHVTRMVAYGRFGVPGFSYFFYDRDFVSETIRVQLPCGVTLLHVEGVPPGRTIPGAPDGLPQVVRAHITNSGWLLLPQADGNTLVVMVLQTDPMGAVPTAVANLCATFIPANLGRIYKFMKSLSAEELQRYRAARMERYTKLPEVGTQQAEEDGAGGGAPQAVPAVEKLAAAVAVEPPVRAPVPSQSAMAVAVR